MKEAARPRWRIWLRRLGLGLLILLGLLVIFHRPLIFEGTRYFVVRAAKQQHLDLTYDIEGSIFSTLTISKIRGVPTEPGPIQRLEIGTINLRYSLWNFVQKGLPALLKMVDLRDVYVEITPTEQPPPAKAAKPQQIKFPALFPETLNIANVNFVSHAAIGDTTLEGFFFSLLPDRPGILKIGTLNIPGVRRWQGISAATSFRDRNLLLTDLFIDNEIALRRFNLDASELDAARLRVGLDGTFFGAATTLTAAITELNAANQLALDLQCDGLDFTAVSEYLHLDLPAKGTLRQLAVKFDGALESPATWTGRVDASLDQLAFQEQPLGVVALTSTLEKSQAHTTVEASLDPQTTARLRMDTELPEKLANLARPAVTGRLELKSTNLAPLTQRQPTPIQGDLTLTAGFRLAKNQLTADAVVNSDRLATTDAELSKTHFNLHAEKNLEQKPDAPPFLGLLTHADGRIASLRFQAYTVDALALTIDTRDAAVSLQNASLKKATNSARITATYQLPADLRSFTNQPLDLALQIDAPELCAFLAPGGNATLDGTLKVDGKATARDGVFDGDFAITGGNIQSQGLTVRSIDGQLQIVKNNARLSRFDVVLDDRNALHASGDVQLAAPFAYHGALDVRLADLSRFQPLLDQGRDAPALRGALTASWQGYGDAQTPRHVGAANLDLTGGQFGEHKNLTAHLVADYSPEYLNVPDFRAAAGDLGNAALSLFWRDNRLRISHLAVRQQRLTLLEGSVDLPLVLTEFANPDLLLPNDQPLAISLRTRDLNLRTLFTQLGQKPPPLTGTVNFTFDASGTLDALVASANLRATRLQSTAADEVDPADVTLDVNLRDKRLALDGTVRQRLIQPLRITGSLPIDVATVKRDGKLDPATPLDLRVTLPRSSLAFVSTLAPAIRQSRGTAAIDVRVGGSVARPTIDGNVTSDLETLRFADPSLPPIDRFALRLAFTRDRLRIEQCRGGIAGGAFGASGGVDFARPDDPEFDLRLAARNALVMQNDDLSVRVSSDLRVTGPMHASTVAGSVYVTKSRFFKDIDILPIGLPGRPAPQPPAEPAVISFPQPPLRDWKFDIAIRTTENDPFLVQSNLANGRISMDLHFGGTGLAPWLDGSVRIDQLSASLPFSRLNIESGTIYFTRDSNFVPSLNIRGTSTIRDYDVLVYIYGPVTAPQAIFSSDPPLPQSEIVSLIATGTTTDELTRDPNALAGRAAILLFQKIYRSVFHRNGPPPGNDSFLSRIQFDVGATDPKTGRQSASARIPLTDQIVLVGGLDVGGNFRGQVKYLLRFK
jgi:hypothetical protein